MLYDFTSVESKEQNKQANKTKTCTENRLVVTEGRRITKSDKSGIFICW